MNFFSLMMITIYESRSPCASVPVHKTFLKWKTKKHINSNVWFRSQATDINTKIYVHLKDEPSAFYGTHYVPTADQFDDVTNA